MKSVIVIFLLLSALLLSGCASTRQLYAGPELAEREVAIIDVYFPSSFDFELDGQGFDGGVVALLPGQYEFRSKYKDENIVITLNVKGGQKYVYRGIRLKTPPESVAEAALDGANIFQIGVDYTLFTWFENKETGEVAGGYRPKRVGKSDRYRVDWAKGYPLYD